MAPGENGRLRELARAAVFDIWSDRHRPATLNEIFDTVRSSIAREVEDGAWPKLWNATPIKRTLDRRVNETADKNHPEFWENYPVPPCVMVRPGYYQPNPFLFDDSVREDIAKEASA